LKKLRMGNCECDAEFEGHKVVAFVERVFSDCLYSWTDIISFIFGWISILCWAICMFPQFWVNYKIKRVDGLSVMFLVEWALGDVCNFIGCWLTKALPTQKIQAGYFVFCDLALLSQWFYYRMLGPSRQATTMITEREHAYSNYSRDYQYSLVDDRWDRESTQKEPSVRAPKYSRNASGRRNGSMHNSLLMIVCFCGLLHSAQGRIAGLAVERIGWSPAPSCKSNDGRSELMATIGSITVWISGFTYFISRIPQVVKNFQRKSTDGLSMALFVLAIIGNLTYGFQILLRLPRFDEEFYRDKLPFLLGSIGVFIFDVTIFIQFKCYKGNRVTSPMLSATEAEHRHWGRSPSRTVTSHRRTLSPTMSARDTVNTP